MRLFSNKAEQAAFFGCTIEQINAQLKKNIEQMEQMRESCIKSGKKKVNGYTPAQLSDAIANLKNTLNGN